MQTTFFYQSCEAGTAGCSSVSSVSSSLKGWIPLGLFYDLTDNNAGNPTGISEIGGIEDTYDVRNYTVQRIFNCLHSGVDTPQKFRECLKDNLVAPNTEADIDALFSDYYYD